MRLVLCELLLEKKLLLDRKCLVNLWIVKCRKVAVRKVAVLKLLVSSPDVYYSSKIYIILVPGKTILVVNRIVVPSSHFCVFYQ